MDEFSPLQLWDTIMKKYKVAQQCDEELRRLERKEELTNKYQLQQERLLAIAEATEALAKLHSQETREKLDAFARKDAGKAPGVVVRYGTTFLSSWHPLYWFSCFVRLFPRGDCLERCPARSTPLHPDRWMKCL